MTRCTHCGGDDHGSNQCSDMSPPILDAAQPPSMRWHLASMNDGLFIINAPPRPSTDDVWHDRPDGPSVVLNVTDLPRDKAAEIVKAMNASQPPAAPVERSKSMWQQPEYDPEVSLIGAVKEMAATVSPSSAERAQALLLLMAEDERQAKLHDLLETIREQIRTEVEPEHRPATLFQNIQNAVYAMRGRTRLMDDAAITHPLNEPQSAWQLIETAPKDRPIMLCVEGFLPCVGRWWPVDSCWASFDWEGHFESDKEMSDHVNCSSYEPTHWKPLPAGPSMVSRPKSGGEA